MLFDGLYSSSLSEEELNKNEKNDDNDDDFFIPKSNKNDDSDEIKVNKSLLEKKPINNNLKLSQPQPNYYHGHKGKYTTENKHTIIKDNKRGVVYFAGNNNNKEDCNNCGDDDCKLCNYKLKSNNKKTILNINKDSENKFNDDNSPKIKKYFKLSIEEENENEKYENAINKIKKQPSQNKQLPKNYNLIYGNKFHSETNKNLFLNNNSNNEYLSLLSTKIPIAKSLNNNKEDNKNDNKNAFEIENKKDLLMNDEECYNLNFNQVTTMKQMIGESDLKNSFFIYVLGISKGTSERNFQLYSFKKTSELELLYTTIRQRIIEIDEGVEKNGFLFMTILNRKLLTSKSKKSIKLMKQILMKKSVKKYIDFKIDTIYGSNLIVYNINPNNNPIQLSDLVDDNGNSKILLLKVLLPGQKRASKYFFYFKDNDSKLLIHESTEDSPTIILAFNEGNYLITVWIFYGEPQSAPSDIEAEKTDKIDFEKFFSKYK